jgi:hypothetical protein
VDIEIPRSRRGLTKLFDRFDEDLRRFLSEFQALVDSQVSLQVVLSYTFFRLEQGQHTTLLCGAIRARYRSCGAFTTSGPAPISTHRLSSGVSRGWVSEEDRDHVALGGERRGWEVAHMASFPSWTDRSWPKHSSGNGGNKVGNGKKLSMKPDSAIEEE